MRILSGQDGRTAVEQVETNKDASMLGHSLPRLFELAAARHLKKVAVICGDTQFTYSQLNTQANHFAHVLIEHGVGLGDLIGVALDRSVDLVAVLLAVLKAGAAYMPIDPTFPAQRIGHMLMNANPKMVITSARRLDTTSFWGGECLDFDKMQRRKYALTDGDDLTVDVQPEDLAYVIYTSGSTGQPKGVGVNHGSLCNMLLSMRQEPGCGETDRLLAISPVTFDMAVPDLYLPLLAGGTTVFALTHQTRDPEALVELMEQHSITMMQGTPTIWQMLLDAGWSGTQRLKRIICGGEALPRRLADSLLRCGDSVWNGYGPTETTVYTTFRRVSPGDNPSVGSPIANVQVYVLDANLLPVPSGSPGELYVGGAGVACGYYNNPELTRSRFIENPFHSGYFYRTGDLAVFSEPGELKILGRADDQVKIRGHRIELGDIEAAIAEHGEVSNVVVLGRAGQLIAYCVRAPARRSHANVHTEGEPVKVALDHLLRPWLSERLPSYMMPAFFVEIERFPLTPSGKVNHKALPDPAERVEPVAKPTTWLESQILAVWSEFLGHNHIGIDDNFFEVGGDSARAVRVQAALKKLLCRPVSVAKLFEHNTIRMLAKHLEETNKVTSTSRPTQPPQDDNIKSNRDNNTYHSEDIAIVSMAVRLPGGITTPEEFWDLLDSGRDAITDVPKDRWDAVALYDADPDAHGKAYCRKGGFLSSIVSFDTQLFGISPREAQALHPSQQVMLETSWEAFERAGYTMEQLRGSRTGVFIGVSDTQASYTQDHSRGLGDLEGYTVTGTAGGTMSGRVSYVLGLEGPTMTVDTACSSSLVSTHLACNALRLGECDAALTGGVALLLSPDLHLEFSRLRGMSSDGRCRAFSADSGGLGLAEGAVAVVLKRLSDAQRDGDVIHAVLRGSAVNHGGRSASLTTPSGPAQRRLIREALAASGLRPGDVDYIEAHGTGTRLGDPIEGVALDEVFRGSRPLTGEPLWVGSAKSNIGHTQAPAGLVGLVKVVLALRHSMLPKTLHISEPAPAVDWKAAHMALVREKRPWAARDRRARRAGVSAFGIGGTNAHVIVEEAPVQVTQAQTQDNQVASLPRVLPVVLSGRTDAALRQQAVKLLSYLGSWGKNSSLGDVAYSLATTRNHFQHRMVLLAKDQKDLLEQLGNAPCAASHSDEPRLAMLFTGQGSQWPGMGRELARDYPIFREALEELASHFKGLLDQPLLEIMWASADSKAATLLQGTQYAQTALFALEVALWRLWDSWGVRPQLVLGHSVGELAAAHVAGVIGLDDACRLVAARGRLMQALALKGKMVSLEASAAEVVGAIETLNLGGKADIASYNTPRQTVASGDVDAVEELCAYFTTQGRRSNMLDVSHAFHSHHMDGILADLQAVAETVRSSPPKLAVVSSYTGQLAEPGQMESPDYWVQQARRPVRFSEGVEALVDSGTNIFLELGPRPVLCGIGAACVSDGNRLSKVAWLPSLVPRRDDPTVILGTLAELHSRHVPIDWAGYFKPFRCGRLELPTYAFQKDNFRSEKLMGMNRDGNNGTSEVLRGVDVDTSKQKASRFGFDIKWLRTEVDRSSSDGVWGILCPIGEVAWAEEIEVALSSAGIKSIPVSHLHDAHGLQGLLCLWDSGNDVLRQARDFTAKALAQVQAATQNTPAPPIVWITRNSISINNEDRADGLGAAPLWGLMRAACNEHPELRLRLVDLGRGETNLEALASCLMLDSEPECAVRGGQVHVPRMQRVEPWSPEMLPFDRSLIRKDGAVLVTGGTGGIGQRVVRWLVEAHGIRDIVLVSRRGMGAPGAEALAHDMAQIGAAAAVVAGDVADADSVRDILSLFNDSRPLRGVIHAAAVIDDGVISALTPTRCDAVFAPKVDGAWNLHQLTKRMDLDLFVLFSSVSGVMGTAGQGNYAAANTFLDSLACLRRAEDLPATSIAWGAWEGEGMAAQLSETSRARYAKLGLDSLTSQDGLELLDQAVRSGCALHVAAAYDLDRLRNYYEDRGGVPSLLRSLLGPGMRRSHTDVDAQDWDLHTALSEALPEEHASIIMRLVSTTVAKTLGFSSPDDVDMNLPLRDIGIDSLTAVLTRNQLVSATNLALPISTILDQPNLTSLSQVLLSQVQNQEESRGESSEPASGSVTPPTSTTSTSSIDYALVRNGCLDASLTFEIGPAGECTIRPKSAFVTGATGFVGAFILHELLEMGIIAYCVVRGSDIKEARERLVASLSDYDLWKPEYGSLLHVVVGDMSESLLGLSEETFDGIADNADAIFHAGALVDWMRPLDDYIGPNVISTHEVLRMASRGRAKMLHHISTVSTLPIHAGYGISQDDREYGYATSKYTAERMVAAARWRGAKAIVYRLPFITASVSTGHFRRDRGDFLHSLIAGSVEMGGFPLLDADLSAVLPVDYLCKTIVAIATRDGSRVGLDFDFVGSQSPSFREFSDLLNAAGSGHSLVPFAQWREQALAYAAAHKTGPLARIAALLDRLADEGKAAAMFKSAPAGQHVLGGKDCPVPPVDRHSLRRYLERMRAAPVC
jgi:amino acid adenylation domain-containing protein/thioester reductase-like protein